MKNRLGAAMLALAAAVLGLPATAAEPPPASAFFKRPALRAPKLSPSGRYLAIQTAGKEDRMLLAVVDLQERSSAKVVGGFRNADISDHHWVNEDRLVFQATESPEGERRVDNPGLWGVDRTGENFRPLIQSNQHTFTTGTHIKDLSLIHI